MPFVGSFRSASKDPREGKGKDGKGITFARALRDRPFRGLPEFL